MSDQRGRCIVCRVEGQGKDDFVCEACLDKASRGPIFACHGCGKSGYLEEGALGDLQRHIGVSLSQPGVIVVSNVCGTCLAHQPGIRPTFEIHQPRIFIN